MFSGKKKKIILVIIILVIIGLLLVFWRSRNSKPVIDENANQPLQIDIPSANNEYKAPEVPAQTKTEFSITNLAKNYAARFGSWSTDNPGRNLEELRPLSTAKMKNYLEKMQINYKAGSFSGISTTSLSAEILFLDDTQTTVLVKTQRVETKSDLSTKTYYQEIEVSLVKAGEEWLVDSVSWK
jgi:hypothetical protein